MYNSFNYRGREAETWDQVLEAAISQRNGEKNGNGEPEKDERTGERGLFKRTAETKETRLNCKHTVKLIFNLPTNVP